MKTFKQLWGAFYASMWLALQTEIDAWSCEDETGNAYCRRCGAIIKVEDMSADEKRAGVVKCKCCSTSNLL